MSDTPRTKKNLALHDLRNASIIAEACSGKSIQTIATEHKRNRKWLSVQLNHPKNQEVFTEIYEATIAEAKSRLPDLVSAAFDTMEDILYSTQNEPQRLEAAKAVLNIASRHWKPDAQPVCTCKREHAEIDVDPN